MTKPRAGKSRQAAKPTIGHSAEYFGPTRAFWWNQDFLELMARRWGLAARRNILDVGCGVGHWTSIVASLAPAATVFGVDRDPGWVAVAADRAREAGLGSRVAFAVGLAESLPFPDASFECVTCQTLLIHVPDVVAVLREMWRVLVPGGQICVVEPNNLVRSLADVDMTTGHDLSTRLALVRLQLTCEVGKAKLGRGFNSAGEGLAANFTAAGFERFQAYLSDRCASLVPPYASDVQQAEISEAREWSKRDFWTWDKAEAREYFRAAGGDEEDFAHLWALARQTNKNRIRRIDAGDRSECGGGIVYLCSAIKAGSPSINSPRGLS